MKTKYVMPTVQVVKITTGATMITASSNGESILRNGGDTGTAGITVGNAREARFSDWDEEEE